MVKMRSGISLMVIIVLAMLLLIGCSGGPQSNTKAPIKIGVVASLTGAGADWGYYLSTTAKMAVDEINAKGGVDGRKIELYNEDTQSQPTISVSASKKLVFENKVDFILSSGLSLDTLAAMPIYEQNGMPFLVTVASAPKISRQDSNWLMAQLPVPEDFCQSILAGYIVGDKGIKKVGIIYENSDWGSDPAKAAANRIKELGGQVTAMEAYNPKDTDMMAQILKIKSSGAEALLCMSLANHTAIIVRQTNQAGLNVPIFLNQANSSKLFLDMARQYSEGASASVYWSPFQEDPTTKKFVAEYKKLNDKDAVQACASTYDGIYMIAEAIQKTGGTDKQKVRDYIRNIGNRFTGVTGKFNIDPATGRNVMTLQVTQVQNGVWRIIGKASL